MYFNGGIMRYFLLLLAAFTITAIAGVYTYQDSAGAVVFTDSPETPNAQRLTSDEIGKPMVVPSPQRASSDATDDNSAGPDNRRRMRNQAGAMQAGNAAYKNLAIISPQDKETIQNQPVIPVSVTTDPVLQKGDSVQIYLDGKPWGPAKPQTQFTFTQPDRGTHTLSAVILNSSQQILLQTQPITVYIHQAHLGNFP
jgi:hypothetical protein